MDCPHCNTPYDGTIICDNDCKTIICSKCDYEFYIDENNQIVHDHDPQCDNSDNECNDNFIE